MKISLSIVITMAALLILVGCQNEAIYGDLDVDQETSDYEGCNAMPGPKIILKKCIEDLSEGEYWYALVNARGIIEVGVTSCGPIDILILDQKNFEAFRIGTQFTYQEKGSRLNVTTIRYEFEVPVEPFYFVLSNIGNIEGGAIPQGPVDINTQIYGSGVVVEEK